jgi:hypothetical protein
VYHKKAGAMNLITPAAGIQRLLLINVSDEFKKETIGQYLTGGHRFPRDGPTRFGNGCQGKRSPETWV